MPLTPENAVRFLQERGFHLFRAKSSNESLLIHSLSVFSLVDQTLRFSQIYTEADKEVMRWAALLHDYGKAATNWQRAGRGPHKVRLGDVLYDDLRAALGVGIAANSQGLLNDNDIDDILFIIEFHHGSGRGASNPVRSRMKDVVSECDKAVSQDRISEDLIRTLNVVVDTLRYRLFTIELIEHPISSLVIGAFDYVLSETKTFWPLLYSAASTLYVGQNNATIPPLSDINRFLNEHLRGTTGVLSYDNSNERIYTDARRFLELASDTEAFVEQATQYANRYCERQRKTAQKKPDWWSDEKEDIYLYGRVCATTYNTLLKLWRINTKEHRPACLGAGGRPALITVMDLTLLGLRKEGTVYGQTLRNILELLQSKRSVKSPLEETGTGDGKEIVGYDATDLLAPDSSVYPGDKTFDPKSDAARDYDIYWSQPKQPLKVCPACNNFPQGNLAAGAFPAKSPLGGFVEVFYTTYMRRIKKEGPEGKGVSFCSWCSRWWDAIATDFNGDRQLYRLCIVPHHLFGRLDWREILGTEIGAALVDLGSEGTVSVPGVFPHIAVLRLKGQDREALIKELVAAPERGNDQIVDRMYRYGLTGAVIVTNPVTSRHLLTCGSISIDTAEWPLLRTPLKLLNPERRTYATAITALQRSKYAFGTLLAEESIKITRETEKEVRQMISELAEETGLTFLRHIWIGGKPKHRLDNAGKVIRGMNETLRRLGGSEDNTSLIDAMVAKGMHLALTTRDGHSWSATDQASKEEAALHSTAEKLFSYRHQTARRTELVRAMIYTLAYLTKPEPEKSGIGADPPNPGEQK